MKVNITALLSTTAVVFAFGSAHAAPLSNESYTSRMEVQSYAELLDPVPNAVEKLRTDDLFRVPSPARLIVAQYHHHHHHHHHHHFDDGPAGIIGGIIGGVLAAPAYAPPPDCYWTQGRPYWDGYRWARRRVQVCE